VIIAPVPEEAFQAGLSHPGRIDHLLTDVVMPKVSGREAFDALLHKIREVIEQES